MKLWQRRTLGILATGGSTLGMVLSLAQLAHPQWLLAYVFLFAGIAVYAWGVWCGVEMLEGSSAAVRHNRIFWAIQIPVFQSPLLGYTFSSGAYWNIAAQLSPFEINNHWRLGSEYNYSLLQLDKPWLIGVNILALAIFLFLTKQISAIPSNNSFKATVMGHDEILPPRAAP